jgi:hypothetical protein
VSPVIAEDTEVGRVEGLLAAEGLRVERVTRHGGVYRATLRVLAEARADARINAATGSGPTLASALEDARQGWARWRDVLSAWSAEGDAARND